MTCIVTGFPSRFAALQFEWAWQNTHATRHIEKDVRDARRDELQKGKKNASPAKRARPPMSLEARLKNLHHLLGAGSFSRWPLHLRFFAPDVFAQWERHIAKLKTKLRESVTVQLIPAELPKLAADVQDEMRTHFIPEVIRAIPVAYEDCKPYIEKSKSTLEDERRQNCGVCRKKANTDYSLILICPVDTCQAVSHLACLSQKFLAEERNKEALVPMEGTCPSCYSPIRWSTMIKELSLRLHGENELKALFKPKRKKKSDNTDAAEILDIDDFDDDLDETWIEDVKDDEDKVADTSKR
jgi:structure-specific endonuclease subunit SLX1